MFGRCSEQPLEPSSEVSSFADVRLGLWIVATKQKHSGRGWNGRPEFSIVDGDELEAMGKHTVILVWIHPGRDGWNYVFVVRPPQARAELCSAWRRRRPFPHAPSERRRFGTSSGSPEHLSPRRGTSRTTANAYVRRLDHRESLVDAHCYGDRRRRRRVHPGSLL